MGFSSDSWGERHNGKFHLHQGQVSGPPLQLHVDVKQYDLGLTFYTGVMVYD